MFAEESILKRSHTCSQCDVTLHMYKPGGEILFSSVVVTASVGVTQVGTSGQAVQQLSHGGEAEREGGRTHGHA